MGISFICAQFSMTHLLGCFERSSFSVLEKEDIVPCPILNKEKVKIVFCYFYVLKHHRVPTNLNKMDPNMQVFDAILTGTHVCESKGVFNVFFDCS